MDFDSSPDFRLNRSEPQTALNHRILILAVGVLLLTCRRAPAGVQVVVGHNANEAAVPGFKFKNIPSPNANNAARSARFAVVDGTVDDNSGGLDTLHDGRLPDEADQPAENFFFRAGTDGGRLEVDLGRVINLRAVNTYSWHPSSRGPQVYNLYASDGTGKDFNATPPNGTVPESCGWKFIAKVDTRSKDPGVDGGQYGVSISDPDGALGKFRYLLLEMAPTELVDANGNTFYSEIEAIDADAPVVAPPAVVQPAAPSPFIFKTADGKCEITLNYAGAPDLKEWSETKLVPVLAAWYPQIVAMLPSPGFTAPAHFSVTIKSMAGVADTRGTRVNVSADWLRHELNREAKGSLVHEMVHVVQQYGRNGYGSRAPGWLVEGMADYIRWFKYEPQSHGADLVWMRKRGPNFSPHYDGSYRVTANFLNWVVEKYDASLISQLNQAMRDGVYADSLWPQYTGKTAAELGAEWQKEIAGQLSGKTN